MANSKPTSPTANNHNNEHQQQSEFVKSLGEFFRRDLVTIPVVKKYPHVVVQQKCGLKAATLELDTAAYPNIEYVAGTRLSVYPTNPASHVAKILDYLVDDISQGGGVNIALPPSSQWWAKFVHQNRGESLKLALTHLFDIMTAPTREVLRLLADYCCANPTQNEPVIAGKQVANPTQQQQQHQQKLKEHRKKLLAICNSNESWEKWLCSGHRTLKSLFDDLPNGGNLPVNSKQLAAKTTGHQLGNKISAQRLLNELELQQPRQYSISNIKSSKRFRAEIIVFQHKFSLRQIQLNLRQLRERESFDKSISSSPKSPKSPSTSSPQSPTTNPNTATRSPASKIVRASGANQIRNVAETSSGSRASMRSIRSLAPFATSPPISTHQVKRVPSFSGPLMSAYATASTSLAAAGGGPSPGSSMASQATSRMASASEKSQASSRVQKEHQRMRSKMSLLSAPEIHSDGGPPTSPSASSQQQQQQQQQHQGSKFDGLCSNYLLSLNTNDTILCEFVENPRFTLKGNRERPIMMIGQDIGLIAFRPFWQQRNLEHDRAQVFYTLFKDLSPKKFGDMHLVCLTGHRSHIEELLFKREINSALTSKILSSVTYLNRKHLVPILSAAHTKSRLLFSQTSSDQLQPQVSQQQQQQAPHQHQHSKSSSKAKSPSTNSGSRSRGKVLADSQNNNNNNNNNDHVSLQITNKELLELGDRIYKLLVENNGCLYTCCDPFMTQAIELLTFESIARNNSQLSRERIRELLPMWKGRGQVSGAPMEKSNKTAAASKKEAANAIFTLENTYERAKIVQEIYDSSI